MIESDCVSESDLLFLIPNNIKRMHGLPVTRISAKRKSKYKHWRKRQILGFKFFEFIEEIIDEILPKRLTDEFFGQFVDVNNIAIGDKYEFVCPNDGVVS